MEGVRAAGSVRGAGMAGVWTGLQAGRAGSRWLLGRIVASGKGFGDRNGVAAQARSPQAAVWEPFSEWGRSRSNRLAHFGCLRVTTKWQDYMPQADRS